MKAFMKMVFDVIYIIGEETSEHSSIDLAEYLKLRD